MVQESWSWDYGKVPIQGFSVSIHKTRGSEWSNRAYKRVSRESLCVIEINVSDGEWWRNVFTKYWCYVGNVEIQGIPTKSGEFIAKSEMGWCKREVCSNGVVFFTDLKCGKRFVVFKKVVHFGPD